MFESLLVQAGQPVHLLYIFGPGGIGKSTLLKEFRLVCEQQGIPCAYLDARTIDPAPESLVAALAHSMGGIAAPLEEIAAQAGPYVLLIDTYETIAPLDDWLRETFLPQLPANTLTVLSGREAPSLAWRADPGWRSVLHVLPLRNLSQDEGQHYLSLRGVPAEQHAAVLDFTHGHPLALSLVADVFAQREGIEFQPEEMPNVIYALLEQFVQKVPGPAHRAALEVCALVRLTTESLLADLLSLADSHDLFEWLRGLSFIDAQSGGLFPHDLAREILVADLRWRNPDWYAELHRRARAYYGKRLKQGSGVTQQQLLLDYIYLHRDNPVVRPVFEWRLGSNLLVSALQEADIPPILEMVAGHEGPEAARLADDWISRQPQAVLVVRGADHAPAGFAMMLALNAMSPSDLQADPAVAAAWKTLSDHAPLRPGECATLFRFWMARDTYQEVSPIQSLLFLSMVRHYLTTPNLAYTFLPCAQPDFWAPVFAYADLHRQPEADFVVDGQPYGVYGHDWRVRPPLAWLELLGERETNLASDYRNLTQTTDSIIVLSKSDFIAAVFQALRDYQQPQAFQANPLLRSRLVVERLNGSSPVSEAPGVLHELLAEAVDSLRLSPRQAKFYRAVYHTYFQPAPTQEQAAELLDLPFSTYRRHLKAGMDHIAELLWQHEVASL